MKFILLNKSIRFYSKLIISGEIDFSILKRGLLQRKQFLYMLRRFKPRFKAFFNLMHVKKIGAVM